MAIKTDQRDQTDLRIDVKRRRPAFGEKRHIRARHFQENEDQRAEERERDRAEKDDERIAEAVKLRGEHEKNQHDRERRRRAGIVALDPQLAGFAGVIDRVTLRQNLAPLRLRGASSAWSSGQAGNAADRDGVELLKAVERARDGFFSIVATVLSGNSLSFGPVT